MYLIQSSLSGIKKTLDKLKEGTFKIETETEKLSFEKLCLIKAEFA